MGLVWPEGFQIPARVLKEVFLTFADVNAKKPEVDIDMHAVVASQVLVSSDVVDSHYMSVSPAAPLAVAQQWMLQPFRAVDAPPHPMWVRKDVNKMERYQ